MKNNISFYDYTTKRNNGHSNGWVHWIKIIRSHHAYEVAYFTSTLYSNRPNELAKRVCTEHLNALNLL